MSEYSFRILKEMPKVKSKAKKKGNLRKLWEKLNEEEWTIAEIPVPAGQKSLGIRIGLGRIFKQDKITNIEVYERTDGKAVVLKKK